MAKTTIRISGELLAQWLSTGSRINYIVDKGLPPGARLVAVELESEGFDVVLLTFEGDDCVEGALVTEFSRTDVPGAHRPASSPGR